MYQTKNHETYTVIILAIMKILHERSFKFLTGEHQQNHRKNNGTKYLTKRYVQRNLTK